MKLSVFHPSAHYSRLHLYCLTNSSDIIYSTVSRSLLILIYSQTGAAISIFRVSDGPMHGSTGKYKKLDRVCRLFLNQSLLRPALSYCLTISLHLMPYE